MESSLPPSKGPRIAVYSHDTFGLGNARRMLAVCEALLAAIPESSILLLSGSPVIHRLHLPRKRFDYIKLPALQRTHSDSYEVRSLGITLAATLTMRSQMIASALSAFHPDLVLVDKKPGGIENELLPALQTTENCRWVLLLRDILDDPEKTRRTWHRQGYFRLIARHYERVLVMGTPEIFDMRREYAIPDTVAHKYEYCGYLYKPSRKPPPLEKDTGPPTVLVTPGGGQDGFPLLDAYLEGLSRVPGGRWRSRIVTGPELPPVKQQLLMEKASRLEGHEVTIDTFSPDIPALIAVSDLVVAMGGYNTLCEIVSQEKQAIIVPRTHPTREQWLRAERFARQGLVHCLDPKELTPARLMKRVSAILNGTLSTAVKAPLDLNGLPRLTARIRSLLSIPAEAHPLRLRCDS